MHSSRFSSVAGYQMHGFTHLYTQWNSENHYWLDKYILYSLFPISLLPTVYKDSRLKPSFTLLKWVHIVSHFLSNFIFRDSLFAMFIYSRCSLLDNYNDKNLQHFFLKISGRKMRNLNKINKMYVSSDLRLGLLVFFVGPSRLPGEASRHLPD